jgi:hypothetical protein
MRNKKSGKKFPVPGILITFENNHGQIQVLDRSPIVAVRPVDNWIIKGAKIPNPVIEVFFEDIPSYPIGYFRDEISRDVALKLIKNSKGSVHLPYEVFFKPTNKRMGEMQTALGQAPFIPLLQHKVRKLKQSNVEFLPTWNANCKTKLTPLQWKELKNGVLAPEINRGSFVIDCLFFFGVDGNFKKRLYHEKISPIAFWSYVVDTIDGMQRSKAATEKRSDNTKVILTT